MNAPGKIQKLDETVVNRIAAGEIIQRPANALKELIENSLDAKSTNIQIVTKEGGLKLLQIQDNGTGIRKEDMEIVCERFTTSKLQKFEDLKSIATYGFRGEALASISHIALLTITTKTVDEKCAYKASYIDSKMKAPVKPCAGNQGTTITIENLFYNIATRRKALSNSSEEFSKIHDVIVKYAIHNPTVGFVLKKHGEISPQVRSPHSSTKMNNIRLLYGNRISRELLEIEVTDDTYKFKMHALVTNPNYTSKRITSILFINNRLVECSSIRKMLEDVYSFYLPKKTHPWCYMSLEISPENVDVNVHPTKFEVKFLHEQSIVERMRLSLDERLSANSASRTFYLQARLPKEDITREVLKEVLPEYEKDSNDKSKKLHPREMIRTDSSDQKLDKFNFTVHTAMTHTKKDDQIQSHSSIDISIESLKSDRNKVVRNEIVDDNIENIIDDTSCENQKSEEQFQDTGNDKIPESADISAIQSDVEKTVAEKSPTRWSDIVNDTTSTSSSSQVLAQADCNLPSTSRGNDAKNADEFDSLEGIFEMIDNEFTADDTVGEECIDIIADKARKRVYQYFGNKDKIETDKTCNEETSTNREETNIDNSEETDKRDKSGEAISEDTNTKNDTDDKDSQKTSSEFKSYSVNNFRREVKLTSVLKLRKEVEDDCHQGLREILSNLTFVGCIDQNAALIQSGLNLYICKTNKLAEELFYEIMLYDFANYGVIKFSEALPLHDLALLGLDTEEAGWTEEDGDKGELATSVKELLLEKADMLKEYFSIVIDKRGNLKSLPILVDKYFPYEAGLPLYMLRLSTEVDWSSEQTCFRNICRETAKFYSQMNPIHDTPDWKHITEHILYPAIKESLLPPKHFSHDSTILKIASLPNLYKVFERC